MDYEKAYKEALERAREELGSGCFDRGTVEYIFPELKESEDERIRKWIIDDIRYNMNNEPLNNSEYKKKAEKAIAWLEKQGENSPVLSNSLNIGKKSWTEEDEKYIDNCCLLIGAADDCYEKTFKDDCIHYLQSLKERIAPKPKWTDEDEKRLQFCISSLQGKGLMGGVDTINTKWLKSLKQRIEKL